jgi:DNA-directed RNA polymerase specialized sigma24 family protein
MSSPRRSHSTALARRGFAADEADVQDVEEAPGAVDLETIYRRHVDAVATWTRRLGGPELDVEDIVHEVFLVVQRRSCTTRSVIA